MVLLTPRGIRRSWPGDGGVPGSAGWQVIMATDDLYSGVAWPCVRPAAGRGVLLFVLGAGALTGRQLAAIWVDSVGVGRQVTASTARSPRIVIED